jgi:hypothetical protein
MSVKTEELDLFEQLKQQLLNLDPVYFCQKYLMLDGEPFSLEGNGYKPFADIYRYIGIKALEPNSKPTILVKGRQVGGTTLASALEMYFCCSGAFGTGGRPPVRIIHAFPQAEVAQKYTREKLNAMIAGSVASGERDKKGQVKSYIENLLDKTSDSNDSLSFKQFTGSNFIRIDSTGLDGGRLRGGTADIIFYDEVQDISGEAIGNTVEMLKQAKIGRQPGGVQVYFGTPKKKGSDFNRMWNVSNQQYFNLGCEKCKQLFPLYTPESDEWKKIWIRGFIVKCPHCNFEQNKLEAAERGKWVATKDINDPKVLYVGFHINQFYMPKIKREDIDAEEPGTHPTNTERKFRNEVLGEFYHGDSSPISFDEIVNLCGDRERKCRARINKGDEHMVVLGIDYGLKSNLEEIAKPDKNDKQGQSYTTAVLMSVKGPNLFSIDLAFKFQRNDPESKRGIIDNLMRQYNVDLCVGDIGFSYDFSYALQASYGDKYLVSNALSRLNDKIKFDKDEQPRSIKFERDFYISEIYELLKKGQIRFPLGDYDRVGWLINHCTSMELKPSISKHGDHTIHYVKGSTPNDGFMAMLNAYLAYKFIITKGFTDKNPMLQQQNFAEKNRPLAITGYVPRKF